MTGEPIESVNKGVQTLVTALRQDPFALETAHLSVITFDTYAAQVVPLTDLMVFQAPNIIAWGATCLGKALELVSEKIDTEVVKTTMETKGDWKPMVFIMTDGVPTDDWEKGLKIFKTKSVGAIIACSVGKHAKTDILKKITDIVVELETADERTISAFFKWVSASISTGSQKVESGNDIDLKKSSELPPPPPEINFVD